jgi:DNA-directed RNA polymerase specialized sigma24 family protein
MSRIMSDGDFKEWLEGLLRLAPEAYRILDEKVRPFVMTASHRYLSLRARHLQLDCDVAQSTLCAVWKRVEAGRLWEDEKRFRAWLNNVTRAHAIDVNRHLARVPKVEPDAAALSREPSPISQVIALECCVELLWDGYTINEIAALTRLHKRTVRKKLVEAREIANRCLDRGG